MLRSLLLLALVCLSAAFQAAPMRPAVRAATTPAAANVQVSAHAETADAEAAVSFSSAGAQRAACGMPDAPDLRRGCLCVGMRCLIACPADPSLCDRRPVELALSKIVGMRALACAS